MNLFQTFFKLGLYMFPEVLFGNGINSAEYDFYKEETSD